MESEQLAQRIADLVLDKKGLDVVILDVRGKSSYTDFLVLTSGTSDRHVQAIAENCQAELKKTAGIGALGVEGTREGQWALVDFGGAVLHVFHQFTREVYDLEGMWKDAPRLPVDQQAQAV